MDQWLYGSYFRRKGIASMKAIVLLIVAIILGSILIPVSFVYAVITIVFKSIILNFKFKYPGKSLLFGFLLTKTDYKLYFTNIAISIDQAGNTVGYKMFNDILIKPNGHKFGNPDETISSVIGKNKLRKKLSMTGKILDWILCKLDPGHSLNSIE